MIEVYNKMEKQRTRDLSLARAIWGDTKKLKEHHDYILEVKRDSILEQSLEKIVKVKVTNGLDPLKLQLKI
jgi:hypothetical protein